MKMRMSLLCSAAALALVASGATLKATIVMDQIGPGFTNQDGLGGPGCQDFEAVNNAFDVAALDDFVLTSAFQLNTIEVCVTGYGGFTSYANVQSWRVEVYSTPANAAANLTGNIASVSVPTTSVNLTQPWQTGNAISAKADLDVSSFPALNLPAGTYWIAVIPVLNFGGGGGQMATLNSNFAGNPGNGNSRQANPGGGFGLPGNLGLTNTNLAIRIDGTSAGSISPSLTGASTPFNNASGDTVTLTATVTPGENPPSSGLAVTVDLTQLGGGASVAMNDQFNGTFTLDVTIGANPPCGNLLLPATVTDAELRSGNGNIPVQVVAALTPTPGATPDAEPDCGLPADTVNGGCNVTPNIFQTLTCGQTVQGTVRANTATRDTDWYSFTLAAETAMSWSVIGQANIVFGFVRDTANLTIPPVCGSPTLAINPVDVLAPCECGTVSATLGAGTWWAFVSTTFNDFPCGRTYEATLRCGALCPGDVNLDGQRNGKDVQAFVSTYPACFAGAVNNCTACQAADVDGDANFTTGDVAQLVTLLLAGDPCP